ncbi:MAG: ribosome silencing factor [Elusimicrobiota bacterium]
MAEETPSRQYRRVAVSAAAAAFDKKGEEIVLLNVRAITGLADYLLLVSVGSPAQMEAIQEKIEGELKAYGLHAAHRDGRKSGQWRVLDYGALMVHLMDPEARELYSLEKLFRGARKVAWKGKEKAKSARTFVPPNGSTPPRGGR